MTATRIDWVDYSKGICIILVVMMHAVLSWGSWMGQSSFMHEVVEFARPFRMPDFFLLAGLFLGRSIHTPLREYVDRKVLHFIYFYVLWLVIQMTLVEFEMIVRDPAEFGAYFLRSLTWDPYNTLWFVHMLAIFYIVTRVLRNVPVMVVLIGASALQIIYHTDIFDAGWTVNRFCDRYIYFFVGYALAPKIFEFAELVRTHPIWGVIGLGVWALANGFMVQLGGTDAPFVSLAMGFVGAGAVVATGALLSNVRFARPLAYVGANSIVVYLTFFFPLRAMQKVLFETNAIPDVGWAALTITAVAVITPLIFHYFIKGTWLNFLYVRPQLFRIIPGKKAKPADTPIAPQPSSSAARGAK